MGRTRIIYLNPWKCSGILVTTSGGSGKVAFIRKRGHCYYLVHNVRKKGRVCQIYLARLGRRPRINDEIIEGVNSKHPFVRVDWEGLKQRASSHLIQPFENNSQFLRDLMGQVRDLNLDIAGLHLPVLRLTVERELMRQLVSELRLLKSVLDVKLRSSRTLLGSGDYGRKGRRG